LIEPGWRFFRSIDFGYENPFVCLYIVVDPSDRVYIYAEYYQRWRTVEKHSEALNEQADREYEYTVCDVSGASERATLRENGIDTIATQTDVVAGLEVVRQHLKLRDDGKPGLYVSSRCIETIKEFNQYHYPESGNVEIPAKEHDHCCFVAGTQIETKEGQRPIETIKTGDRVLTRDGYRAVLQSEMTGIREVRRYDFTNGSHLIGTGDHPIITERGSIALRSLSYSDIIYTSDNFNTLQEDVLCQEKLKRLSLMERLIEGIQILAELLIGDISAQTERLLCRESAICTGRYGNIITGIFPKATTSTTSTATRGITISPISNVFQLRNISANIRTEHRARYLKPLWTLLLSGINPRKPENFINILARLPGRKQNIGQRSASCVEMISQQEISETRPNIVQPTARPLQGEDRELTRKSAFARYAGATLRPTSMRPQKPVRVNAEHRWPTELKPVYNLRVEDKHEYYANGILVSNCDALRDLIMNMSIGYTRQVVGVYA